MFVFAIADNIKQVFDIKFEHKRAFVIAIFFRSTIVKR